MIELMINDDNCKQFKFSAVPPKLSSTEKEVARGLPFLLAEAGTAYMKKGLSYAEAKEQVKEMVEDIMENEFNQSLNRRIRLENWGRE